MADTKTRVPNQKQLAEIADVLSRLSLGDPFAWTSLERCLATVHRALDPHRRTQRLEAAMIAMRARAQKLKEEVEQAQLPGQMDPVETKAKALWDAHNAESFRRWGTPIGSWDMVPSAVHAAFMDRAGAVLGQHPHARQSIAQQLEDNRKR